MGSARVSPSRPLCVPRQPRTRSRDGLGPPADKGKPRRSRRCQALSPALGVTQPRLSPSARETLLRQQRGLVFSAAGFFCWRFFPLRACSEAELSQLLPAGWGSSVTPRPRQPQPCSALGRNSGVAETPLSAGCGSQDGGSPPLHGHLI